MMSHPAESPGIQNKIAIVTGAGQGIGQGIALALGKAGARVMLAGKTLVKLEETKRYIETAGGQAATVSANVSEPEDIARIVESTVTAFGGVDILVNNAQQAVLGPLLDLDDAGFRMTMDTGPLAVFRLMKAVQPQMKQRGGGAIINLATSAAISWNTSGAGVYACAKQGIRALSRAAASEWGPDGIRVNTIAPLGASPSFKTWLEAKPEGPDEYLATIPLRRVGDPEIDIGRVVVFLVGPAARYITGATIPVDGGQANFD
jgi:NAD(P)-dependent dehydrogenase (short-subunit alcohol dehydrogenase family)